MGVVRSKSPQGRRTIRNLRIATPDEAHMIEFEADDQIDGFDMVGTQGRAAMTWSRHTD